MRGMKGGEECHDEHEMKEWWNEVVKEWWNEVVKVNRSGLAKASDSIGAVSQPLSGLVTIWTLLRLVGKGMN